MTPGIGDLAALQHDVVDISFSQTVTNRQTGMPGADDYGVDITGWLIVTSSGHPVLVTLTLTFVGLVTMSKTAERFCD